MMLKTLGKLFIDLILPPSCLRCSEPIETNGNLCVPCWKNIAFSSEPCCKICSQPFQFKVNDKLLCLKCSKNLPYYDRAFHLFAYDDFSKKLIIDFKFYDKTNLAPHLARMLTNKSEFKNLIIDYIISVPMHKKKLQVRLFNQSTLLARNIAPLAKIKFLSNCLLKIKNTKPQSELSHKERLKNLANVFAVSPKYKDFLAGKNVLIVDDVFTTGATLNECAKTLKQCGVSQVFVATLAKTI
jgi:ComF family protein